MHTAFATARLRCGVRARVCPTARGATGFLYRHDQPLPRPAAARPRASHHRARILLTSLTALLPGPEGL